MQTSRMARQGAARGPGVGRPAVQHLRGSRVRTAAQASDKRAPREENVEGNFFVDHTCM